MDLLSRLTAAPVSSAAADGRLLSMLLNGLASIFLVAVYAAIIFSRGKMERGFQPAGKF